MHNHSDLTIHGAVLDAPGNNMPGSGGKYSCQIHVSWPVRNGCLNGESGSPFASTTAGSVGLIRTFAQTWAEPFRSLATSIPEDTDIKCLELYDWAPPRGLRTTGSVALVGDAFHPMSMCEFLT